MPALYLTEENVNELLTVVDAIEALDTAFRRLADGEAAVQPRQRVRMPHGLLHVMPAGIQGGPSLGLKVYTTFAGAGARFFVMLFDANEGSLVAILQADRLGQIRTGAASGVATRYMAREDSRSLGLFGTGWQAQSQLLAMCAVRNIEHVRVYGREAERRRRFCEVMAAQVTATLEPVDHPRAAVEAMDIVTTVTSSSNPVFDGAWLHEGTHVNAAGVNQVTKREIDATTVARAGIIVTDLREQAQGECGDLAPLVASGALSWDAVGELADVVSGRTAGRQRREEITLFESQGIALEDMAVAELVYQRAIASGVGERLPL